MVQSGYDESDILYAIDRKSSTFSEFFNKDFIIHCVANTRIVDSFKISQRKIIFASLQRNTKEDINVRYLAGLAAELSSYQHAEELSMDTIVYIGQNFVGSNIFNILIPKGSILDIAMSPISLHKHE